MLIYLCTFLLAFSILLLEVSLTRVFSVMTWHHFTHMIISISLLGFGAAGAYLTVKKKKFSLRWLSRVMLLYSFSVVVSFAIVIRINFAPLAIMKDPTQLISLFLYDAIVAVPFFFAGLGLAGIITHYRDDIHRVYFSDLFGSSLGALAAVWLIGSLGAVATIFLVAIIGAVVALVAGHGASEAGGRGGAITAIVIVGALFVGVLWGKPYLVHVPPSKSLSNIVNPSRRADALEWSRWNVVARIDITKPMRLLLSGYGGNLSGRVPLTLWSQRLIFQDGAAPTGILKLKGTKSRNLHFLEGYLQAAPYALVRNPRVLVIGVGGGNDVLIALYHGAKHVTGAEINPLMVRAVTKDFAEFTANVFNSSKVSIINSEGRHFLSSTKKRFDVIQLSGVDTFSALSSGAYALAENYLYTEEALGAMWNRTSSRGLISFSRWFFLPPRETLRLSATMISMLEKKGIPDPSRHVAVVRGASWAETLLSKKPFDEKTMGALRSWTRSRGFSMVFDPLKRGKSEFDTLLRADAEGQEKFYRNYQYQVRPTTDDAPFFFNFYKISRMFDKTPSLGGYVTTDIPLGLATLIMSLGQILLLALIGVFVPMRKVRLLEKEGRWATLVYFGSLGLGFMFIEIALIQKLMVLLGGPVYSLSITLFAILLFSGIGSFLARGRQAWLAKHFMWLGVGIAILAALIGPALDVVMPSLLEMGLLARAVLSILLVAPLALLMGMPFPVGLSVLSQHCGGWVPWAWATNSFLTVLGPLLSIFVGMEVGFRGVFVAAAAIYLLGFFVYGTVIRRVSAAHGG